MREASFRSGSFDHRHKWKPPRAGVPVESGRRLATGTFRVSAISLRRNLTVGHFKHELQVREYALANWTTRLGTSVAGGAPRTP
jgi:hypothetical protein